MLYASLVVSAILLVVVNLIVARSNRPALKGVLACVAAVFVPVWGMTVFPAVAWQALFLALLLAVVFVPRRGRRLYPPLSVVATLVAYLIMTVPAVQTRRENAELRERFPFESLEQRLPVRPKAADVSPPKDGDRLDLFERSVHDAAPEFFNEGRVASLRTLHEDSVKTFVNSPGFGVARMVPGQVSRRAVEDAGHGSPPVQQPDYAEPFVHPPVELSKELPDDAKLAALHTAGVLDFVNVKGFGYVKDRGRVAGFRPHGMSKVPEAETPWKVARIELVGLVVHDKPVAYPSQHLPRMDELRGAPTRELDAFETEGLAALRRGGDLFARGTDAKARMLGAVRAAKQCVECHGCERGDLLGAFSYGLRR